MLRNNTTGMMLVIFIIISLSVDVSAMGMSSPSSQSDDQEKGSLLSESVSVEGPFARHGIGVLAGYSFTPENDEFRVGGNYEFRFYQYLGIGLMFDYSGGNQETSVFALPFYIHPGGVARVVAAPAMRTQDSENEFLFRSGLMYDLYLHPRFILSPTIYLDIVENHMTVVVGVSFETEF